MSAINLSNVFAARRSISGFVQQTPCRYSTALSALANVETYLKLENVQNSGSFKIRGAANRLLHLSESERKRGVVTVSTGNHGKAIAAVGSRMGVRVVVCVPRQVLHHKVEAIRGLGAEIVVHGDSQDEAEAFARDFAEQHGMVPVSAFDDPYIIAGSGTIGLEIVEELPDLQMIAAPLSGGGLLGGIATVCKTVNPAIHTMGVSMEKGPAMVRSIEAGRPIDVAEEETLADSLVGGIGLQNLYTFDLIRTYVDEFVLVSEQAIEDAVRYAWQVERLVVEGGAAVALAAMLTQQIAPYNGPVVLVLSGGNVDTDLLLRVLK